MSESPQTCMSQPDSHCNGVRRWAFERALSLDEVMRWGLHDRSSVLVSKGRGSRPLLCLRGHGSEEVASVNQDRSSPQTQMSHTPACRAIEAPNLRHSLTTAPQREDSGGSQRGTSYHWPESACSHGQVTCQLPGHSGVFVRLKHNRSLQDSGHKNASPR